MFRIRSFTRRGGAAALLIAGVSGGAAAQRGSLSATLNGHRTAPMSDTLVLVIAGHITPGWHIGAAQPGATGVPTELAWRLPVGWRVIASRWPAPTSAVTGRDTAFEYHGRFAIETTLVPDGPQHSGPIEVVVTYGICRDVCIPGRLTLTYEVR